MHFVQKFTVIIPALLLSGCVTTVLEYRPPEGEETARLLMRGAVEPGETYTVYLFDDPENCQGLLRVGTGQAESNPPAVKIKAKGLATVSVFFTKPNRARCQMRWSFHPKPGQSYLVTANSDGKGCYALLMNASNPEKIVMEPSALRRDSGPNLCLPLAESLPYSSLGNQEGGAANLPIAPRKPSEPQLRKQSFDDELKDLTRSKN